MSSRKPKVDKEEWKEGGDFLISSKMLENLLELCNETLPEQSSMEPKGIDGIIQTLKRENSLSKKEKKAKSREKIEKGILVLVPVLDKCVKKHYRRLFWHQFLKAVTEKRKRIKALKLLRKVVINKIRTKELMDRLNAFEKWRIEVKWLKDSKTALLKIQCFARQIISRQALYQKKKNRAYLIVSSTINRFFDIVKKHHTPSMLAMGFKAIKVKHIEARQRNRIAKKTKAAVKIQRAWKRNKERATRKEKFRYMASISKIFYRTLVSLFHSKKESAFKSITTHSASKKRSLIAQMIKLKLPPMVKLFTKYHKKEELHKFSLAAKRLSLNENRKKKISRYLSLVEIKKERNKLQTSFERWIRTFKAQKKQSALQIKSVQDEEYETKISSSIEHINQLKMKLGLIKSLILDASEESFTSSKHKRGNGSFDYDKVNISMKKLIFEKLSNIATKNFLGEAFEVLKKNIISFTLQIDPEFDNSQCISCECVSHDSSKFFNESGPTPNTSPINKVLNAINGNETEGFPAFPNISYSFEKAAKLRNLVNKVIIIQKFMRKMLHKRWLLKSHAMNVQNTGKFKIDYTFSNREGGSKGACTIM